MSKAGASLATCYGPVSADVIAKAENIRLLILDVDGVLSDGLIYMGNNGEELKAFNVRDGYGIRCALTSDIEVAIITGRKAKLVEDRCATLGITHLYQGQSNKLIAFSDLLEKLAIAPENVAYVGDDLIDWPVMEKVGLSVAVADAHPLLLPLVVNNNDPTYKSEHTDTLVYNPEGALSYRLIAQHVEYYSDQAVSWFTQPVLTTFDKDKIPTWSVKADKAKLTNDRMLYLYGHVEVNALVPDSQLRRITTDNAQINLVTQDVTSEDLVTLYGTTFNSSGLKMRGNLRSKNAELIEKVRTSYEIQNKQTQP
ncbi:LPS export ABC transporter periplasmic protein LptC [Escherichia coli]|nr:LPS export ABC transporter periplasmic protein LptC [Escherichia coli]